VPAGRRPSRALPFLLSFVTPGAGHAFAGHIRRGFSWAIGLVAVSLVVPFVMRVGFVGLVLGALLGMAAVLACAIDALRLPDHARRGGSSSPSGRSSSWAAGSSVTP